MDSSSALAHLMRIFDQHYSVLESFWQHFPDNFFVVRCEIDGDFVIELINPAQESALGFTNAQIAGCSIRNIVPAPLLPQILKRYRECVAGQQPLQYEESGAGPGMPMRRWQTMLLPAVGQSGRVEYLFGIARDITAQYEAEIALRQERERLEQDIRERKAELELVEQRLHQLAARDALTGVYTRLHFLELAEREFSLSFRNGRCMSLMLLDIDHFSLLNQRLGPSAGDYVLEQLAAICSRCLRATDLIGRYGGEEFIVLLSDTDAARVQAIAWRLNLEVANSVLNWQDSHFNITLSIGLAHFNPAQDPTLPALIERTEAAMATAKAQGRNRLEISASNW